VKTLEFSRNALSCSMAAALLAGCGGSQSVSPPGMVNSAKVPRTSDGSGNLVYVSVSTKRGGVIEAFDYATGKEVLTLQTHAFGLCSDATGNVFATNYEGGLLEYAHGGGSPIAEIVYGNYPQGCAVDPNTGNLAAVASSSAEGTANLTIFTKASSGYGSPVSYSDSSVRNMFWCAYDDSGNVFVTASTDSNGAVLDELPANGNSLIRITLPFQTSRSVGSIQWDGRYLAIADPIYAKGKKPATIYQLQISGSTATVVNTIKLKAPKNKNDAQGGQLWIEGGTIAYPESYSKNVGLWAYPQGGSAAKTFKTHGNPLGITVSASR